MFILNCTYNFYLYIYLASLYNLYPINVGETHRNKKSKKNVKTAKPIVVWPAEELYALWLIFIMNMRFTSYIESELM